jgi:hypothetical protein
LTPKLVPNPPPGFDDLSVEEKIDYVQSLWERIESWVPSPTEPDSYQLLKNSRRSHISSALTADARATTLRSKSPMGRWLETAIPRWCRQ